MADKDYQNLSTQGSGSITKVTPFQIKSNDGFGSLAIDLEAFRGQFADIIGDGYKTDLSNTTGSAGNNISNVSLKKLANYLNATPANNELRVLNKLSGSGDLALAGSATIQGNLIITGSSTLAGNSFFNGNITLGDTSGDDIALNARFTNSIVPRNTNTIDVGDASTRFRNLWLAGNAEVNGLVVTGSTNLNGAVNIGDATADDINIKGYLTGSLIPKVTNQVDLGSGANRFRNLWLAGAADVAGSLTIGGDLTVNGTTTTINSTTLTVDDKNIILGAVSPATDTGADGGGITLSGSTDHTIIWRDATDAWEFSENVIPSITGAKDLGTSSFRWRYLYAATGSFSAGGNTITVDPQTNKINGSVALSLSASAGDLVLDDKWRGATTTFGSTAGIKLANASADWTNFNTNFPTQNSILGALNQAATSTSNPKKLTYNISASYASGTSVPVNLGTFGGGSTFDATVVTEKNSLVFFNGQLLGSGSTANVQANPATADYSIDAGLNNFRFGFPVASGDIVVIKLD